MDITPIYDLRTRLRAAMIAGTNLLSEDFRLKRAIEAFAPLEAASPVFAKIGQLSRSLLDAQTADREGALLDAITLADAVLCTQGAVSADMPGEQHEIKKLEINSCAKVVTNAPYSVVKSLQEALTTSGSGHYSYVTETHEHSPELFADYRIKAAMVQALGSSYPELADTVEKWLKEEDSSLLPLLKNNFDPKGKKEMIRRIHVMEAIAPKESKDFLIGQLEQAEKEVRQAIIFTLRNDGGSEELLWQLAASEKGNCKKAAYHALACRESEQTEENFRSMYQKDPASAVRFLKHTYTEWSARLLAEKIEEMVKPFETDSGYFLSRERFELLQSLLLAAAGKTGKEITDALSTVISLEDRLNYPFENRKKKWETHIIMLHGFAYGYRGTNTEYVTLSEMLANIINHTLLRTADAETARLAIRAYEEKRSGKGAWEDYFGNAALGHLLLDEDVSEWMSKQPLTPKIAVLSRYSYSSRLQLSLYEAWKNISWSESRREFVMQDVDVNAEILDGYRINFVNPVGRDMTLAPAEIIIQCENERLDTLLAEYISQENNVYRDRLEAYFYKRALSVNNNLAYVRVLKRIGCKKCEGLAVQHFSHCDGSVSIWSLRNYEAAELPGDRQQRYEEMKRVYELVLKGRIKLYGARDGKEAFLEYLEQLKQE